MIRYATPADAAGICRIYNPYVQDTVISFEEAPVPVAAMATRIEELLRTHPWHVAESDGEIAGYAYASPWRSRAAYRHAVETSVYVAQQHAGRGLGRALYGVLLQDLTQRGFHCAMGGIALPNPASIALHESMGFVEVGRFREVGWKFGRWVDVGYWQRFL
jgi:L-amino acid N-acyltransferase YncA